MADIRITDIRMGDPLPGNITAEDIKKMSPTKIRKFISIFGIASVNRRLSGEDPADEQVEEVRNVLTATAILFDKDLTKS